MGFFCLFFLFMGLDGLWGFFCWFSCLVCGFFCGFSLFVLGLGGGFLFVWVFLFVLYFWVLVFCVWWFCVS